MLSAQGAYRFSGIIMMMILARTLNPHDIGLLFFAISLAMALTVFGNWSLDPVMFRRVSAAPSKAAEIFSPLLGLRLATAPLYLLIFLLTAYVQSPADWKIMFAVALFVLLEDVYSSFGQLFVATHHVNYNVTVGLTTQSIFILLLAAGMWWAPSIGMAVAVNIIRSFCLLGLAIPLTIRLIGPLRPRWSFKFVRQGGPFILISFLMLLQGKLDTLMLGFLGTFQMVGYYQLASRIILAGLFIPGAVSLIVFRHVSADGASPSVKGLITQALLLLLAVGATCTAILYFAAFPITRLLYGPIGPHAAVMLKPLAFLLPVNFMVLLLASVLQGLYREKYVVLVLLAATAAELSLEFLLIPSLGAYGAIIGRFASLLAQAICFTLLTFNLIRVPRSSSASLILAHHPAV